MTGKLLELTETDNTIFPSGQAPSRGASLEDLKERNRLHREEIRPRIVARYGQVADADLHKIETAERELSECDGCTGECLKSVGRWVKPVIRVDNARVQIDAALCVFGERNRIRRDSRLAQIPARYVGKTLDDYDLTDFNEDAFQFACWFVENQSDRGAFFYGGVGTGKTMLAAIIAQEFLREFKSVEFGDMPSVIADIKATFGTGKTADFIARLIDCDLLVLDDIGAEKVTDWSAEQLYLIVNGRYNAGKITLATSNYDFEGLIERLGGDITAKRIISRLSEMTHQFFFGTEDRRN